MPGLATWTVWVYAFIVCSGVAGIVAVMREGSYPHYTVSDALSTPSGFYAIYSGGWLAPCYTSPAASTASPACAP